MASLKEKEAVRAKDEGERKAKKSKQVIEALKKQKQDIRVEMEIQHKEREA